MRLAIFENIMTPGGHEVDFDRIIVEEFQKLGHEVSFLVPKGFKFAFDYKVPVKELEGDVVSYTGITGLKKLVASFRREWNRQKWYKQLYMEIMQKKVDAIIIPTSTYRYLRALAKNVLQRSPVPVIFILHGINPKEVKKFFKEAKKFTYNPNIKFIVLTFGQTIFGQKLSNMYTIYPPTFTPRDIDFQPKVEKKDVLKIGFFGQYRREKKLEDFLEVYIKGHYTRPVKLMVQGSTMHPEDAEDFERIIAKYKDRDDMEFLHKGLIGPEWQKAISEIDVLLLPYSANRYLYHWGGMLFTAIGFQKPVIASDDMNPEVFELHRIGELFKSGDLNDLKETLEDFINDYDENVSEYAEELEEASSEFSPDAFAKRVEKIIGWSK